MECEKNNWKNWNWKILPFKIHLKSCKSMKYDILKASAPKMPNLGKGTESIKILLSQVSKDMHEPLVPMLFPGLAVTYAT